MRTVHLSSGRKWFLMWTSCRGALVKNSPTQRTRTEREAFESAAECLCRDVLLNRSELKTWLHDFCLLGASTEGRNERRKQLYGKSRAFEGCSVERTLLVMLLTQKNNTWQLVSRKTHV